MTNIPHNPFTNRSTIKNEHDFVGREQEITNILSRVRNGDSVSVVGDRRIGKSSLLYHLFLTGNRRLEDAAKARFKFIYLDLQEPRFATQARFCQAVLHEITAAPMEKKPPCDELEWLSLLSDALDGLKSQQLLPVLLMDEFEKLVAKPAKKDDPPRFTDDCFNALRAFANAHKLCMVTSSQRTLRELTEQEGLTSPFW
ncbi:MAG: ATP-binding protein, partial [candidate division KSB1 bacterium]|nr:ATP-binding protein [candidate division KSB1 bacterium]